MKRLEELGLLRVVQGRGRKRGCRKDGRQGLVGLSNRYYPGPELVPTAWTDKWIQKDDEKERRKLEPRPVAKDTASPPVDDTPLIDPGRLRELAGRFAEPRAGP